MGRTDYRNLNGNQREFPAPPCAGYFTRTYCIRVSEHTQQTIKPVNKIYLTLWTYVHTILIILYVK